MGDHSHCSHVVVMRVGGLCVLVLLLLVTPTITARPPVPNTSGTEAAVSRASIASRNSDDLDDSHDTIKGLLDDLASPSDAQHNLQSDSELLGDGSSVTILDDNNDNADNNADGHNESDSGDNSHEQHNADRIHSQGQTETSQSLGANVDVDGEDMWPTQLQQQDSHGLEEGDKDSQIESPRTENNMLGLFGPTNTKRLSPADSPAAPPDQSSPHLDDFGYGDVAAMQRRVGVTSSEGQRAVVAHTVLHALHNTSATAAVQSILAARQIDNSDEIRQGISNIRLAISNPGLGIFSSLWGQVPPQPDDILESMSDPSQCNPDHVTVVELSSPVGVPQRTHWKPLTTDDIKNHIRHGFSLGQYAKVPQFPLHNSDGRVQHPVLAVPGGDAGEFLLALNVYERFWGQPLPYSVVEHLLVHYLVNSNKVQFYMQLDSSALDNLCRTTRFCVSKFRLDKPPAHVIPRLRQTLLQSENQGSIYFRNLLEHPDADLFNCRRGLTLSFLTAFLNLLWGIPQENILLPQDQATIERKLRLVVLQGPRTDKALVQIASEGCGSDVPMLVPEVAGRAIALSYVTVAAQNHKYLAQFLAEFSKKIQVQNVQTYDNVKMLNMMQEVSEQQLVASLAYDRGHTPVFLARIPSQCCHPQTSS